MTNVERELLELEGLIEERRELQQRMAGLVDEPVEWLRLVEVENRLCRSIASSAEMYLRAKQVAAHEE